MQARRTQFEKGRGRVGKTGELKRNRDRKHCRARTLRVISRHWENQWGRRSKAREMKEEVDNELWQIVGCYSRSRRVAALSVGGRRPERPLREKGKRRGSWGGNAEERRRAVRRGEVGRKTSVQLGVTTRWVPGQDSEGRCEGPETGPR